MKKLLAFSLCIVLALSALSACTNTPQAGKLGQADNEILTYQKIDPDKTTLFVSTTGNDYLGNFNEEFERQNPDIQIILTTITGGTRTARPIANDVRNGNAADIMFVSQGYFTEEETLDYFENLSANRVIESYQAEALSRLAVNDNIYFLPGPSEINCMLYNKTMFDSYGWEVPKTFDEFVALCVRIREDTNGTVQPWNPNAKYESTFSIATTAFVYEELFGGMENRAWYMDFCNGEATFAGHMEPYYEMLQTLIDNGILLEEHFSYSATERGIEFQNGEIAMYNYAAGSTRSDKFTVGYMPFPGTAGNDGYLVDSFSTALCVTKRERTEAQQDAVQRYLDFFSSPEGQTIFIGDKMMFSNVRDVPLGSSEILTGISEAIADGRYFSRLNFDSPDGISNILFINDARAMTVGEKTASECIADIDAQPFRTPETVEPLETIATVAEDFTILETSFFMADMYREKAGADIGMIAHNVVSYGNIVRMYEGPLDADYVASLKPRSFVNNSTLIKVTMTGRQFLEAINHIVNYYDETNAVFAFSGLKYTVAPWRPQGEMYISVTLQDGTAIEPDKLYTVAMWDGTIDPKYITEIVETYEGTWEELMTETLKAKGTIAPAKDGRITIIWD